jgi:signal transduction histidine kinase
VLFGRLAAVFYAGSGLLGLVTLPLPAPGSNRLRVRGEPAGWLFEVADNGGGLPPGEEQFVFEAFRTGSSPTGRTGLGLSIVRGIARAHGGECGVVNRPERGATFWIRIPR